jgi:hypothetical protein
MSEQGRVIEEAWFHEVPGKKILMVEITVKHAIVVDVKKYKY